MKEKLLYKLSGFCDHLDPYIIVTDHTHAWFVVPYTARNYERFINGDLFSYLGRHVKKTTGDGNSPTKKYTTDREVALDFLAKSLRKMIERLKDLSMRADAVEERDEAAMKKFGVY